MFARVTRFSGSQEQIEAGLRMFREQALPWMREASGYRGFVALVDPAGGRSLGLTFWTTAEAASDAATSGGALRDFVAEHVGTTMESLEILEVAVVDAVQLGVLGDRA